MSKSQFFASVSALLLMTTHAMSQDTLDHLLATVSVSSKGKCSVVDIRLNRPASYLHHFPATSGTSLSITVEPLGTTAGDATDAANAPDRESASVPVGNGAGLEAVSYDPSASGGPELRLSFVKNVAYRVVPDTNTRHLRIDVTSPANALACLGHAETEPTVNTDQAAKSDGPVDSGSPQAVLAEGKAQLAAKDYARATAFFTKAVMIGNGKIKQEAQELLGLARERAGQLPHAQAEYQSYLKQYPKGEGAARVRGRLDGVRAAMEDAAQQQFAERRASVAETKPGKKSSGAAKPSQVVAALTDQSGKSDSEPQPDQPLSPVVVGGLHNTGQGLALNAKEAVKDPNAWVWDHTASIAQTYYRNDNYSSAGTGSGSFGLHKVYQNELLSSADGSLHGQNQDYEMALRASLYNEKGFGQQADIRSTNIGTLYAEGKHKESGLSARLGRQSKSTGGVFGRFDGALLGWQLNKEVKVQAYSGSPVYRRDAKPFADKRMFYGASIDYTFPGDHWAGALYAIAQDLGSITDRRALGMEMRYTDKTLSVYTAGDYDVFYRELNNAYVSANWHVRDGTNVYANADYRRVPFLLTENALMGQGDIDLESLVELWGKDNVYQFALDRTANAKTIGGGISQDISKDWQVSFDGTIAHYSGTPASGGVDEIPDPGIEYYLSASINGSNILKESDSLSMGLRYSGSKTSNFYMADAYYRYPINEKWRLSPRVRFSLRDSKTSDQQTYLVMPSVLSHYRLNKNWSFDSEAGLRWQDVVTGSDSVKTLDLLATAGYRYEF